MCTYVMMPPPNGAWAATVQNWVFGGSSTGPTQDGDIVHCINTKIIGIMVLGLAASVVNYLAVAFTFSIQVIWLNHNCHFHVGCDNTTADAWFKGSQTQGAGLLAHQNPSLYDEELSCGHGCWTYHRNAYFFADAISRGTPAATSTLCSNNDVLPTLALVLVYRSNHWKQKYCSSASCRWQQCYQRFPPPCSSTICSYGPFYINMDSSLVTVKLCLLE